MKKLIYLLGLAMLMAVAACSGSAEKKKSDIRVLMQDSTDAHGVQRMTARKSEVDIKYKGKEYHSFIIALLFAMSYMLYAAREAILLSMVYPFVISYYNFVIMKRLSNFGNLRFLGIIMVFTGWIAGGGGLMSALFGYTYIGVIFICMLLCVEIYHYVYQTSQKRINNVQ
jgi:hypothetical protein